MGCACDKERDKDETEKETLSRVQGKASTSLPAPTQAIKTLGLSLEALYRLEEPLKRNNTGSLLKAVYLGTYQPCFLKVINKTTGRAQIQQRAKLNSEAERLSNLDHPHILRVYEAFQDEENYYLALEPFSAGLLQDLMPDERLNNEAVIAKIMTQVFGMLCYCHQQGIIHGNIGPQALAFPQMEVANPKVKVTGFGEFDTPPIEGTPTVHESHFRAPERSTSNNEKCDIWSCGALIFILLTGQSPTGLPLSDAVPPGSYPKNFTVNTSKLGGRSRELQTLLSSMMSFNPQARPTAAQCRNHAWVSLHVKPISIQPATVKRYLFSLKRTRGHNPLQNAVLKFILLRMMKDKDLDCLVEPFYALDSDSDGLLNMEEMLQGYMKVLAEEDAIFTSKKVMEAADVNKSGDISYSEFLTCSLGEKKLMTPENLRLVFSCVDRNNSGSTTVQDLCNFFLVKSSDLSLPRPQITFEEFSVLMGNANPS